MMAGNPNWWNMYPPPPPPPPTSTLLSSPSSSSTSPYFFHPQYVLGSSSTSQTPRSLRQFSDNSVSVEVDQEQLPHSWSQLLLGGLPAEEAGHFRARSTESNNCEAEDDRISDSSNNSSNDAYVGELMLPPVMPTPWTHIAMTVTSPTSCVTSLSGGANMWDFSKTTKESGKNRICQRNSAATGGASKKARVHVHPPCSQPPLKVRKEKLGDRITALQQMVSPFGKTDTASVLLEVIDYIRFLQAQIEVLSSPYLSSNNGSRHHPIHGEVDYAFSGGAGTRGNPDTPEDLRNRGLCLVPMSCTSRVGNDNGADYWAPAPAFGGGF